MPEACRRLAGAEVGKFGGGRTTPGINRLGEGERAERDEVGELHGAKLEVLTSWASKEPSFRPFSLFTWREMVVKYKKAELSS